MNFRGVGVSFLMISVLLFSSRYIAAAIYGMDSVTKDRELFQNLLDFTGNTLFNLSVISLVIGVLYLVVGEVINTLYFKNINKGNGQMQGAIVCHFGGFVMCLFLKNCDSILTSGFA